MSVISVSSLRPQTFSFNAMRAKQSCRHLIIFSESIHPYTIARLEGCFVGILQKIIMWERGSAALEFE